MSTVIRLNIEVTSAEAGAGIVGHRCDPLVREVEARHQPTVDRLGEQVAWMRNALEHIAGACTGHASDVAKAALSGQTQRS